MTACAANGDSFLQYLRRATDDQLKLLCTRALSTNSVKLAFSEVNANLGYKATAETVLQHLRHIDIRSTIRADPFLSFSLRASKRKLYPVYALQQGHELNDLDVTPHRTNGTSRIWTRRNCLAGVPKQRKQQTRRLQAKSAASEAVILEHSFSSYCLSILGRHHSTFCVCLTRTACQGQHCCILLYDDLTQQL